MGRIAFVVFALLLVCFSFAASDDAYRTLISRPSATRLVATYAGISGSGSRLAGSAGEEAALRFAESRFRSLGLATSREPFSVTIPDPSATAVIEIGGQSVSLLPMWPNLVRTSTCDVTGPLVFGGDGSLEALSHKRIKGSIVVLSFDSGSRWTNAAMLGASAIVFIQPVEMRRTGAEDKFKSIPLDVPRFLVPRAEAGRILSAAEGLKRAHLTCRQNWIASTSSNLIAALPGTDPALETEPIVLWGYADSMSVAPGSAPGAEQSAGLVALLELAEILSKSEHRRPIRFVVSGAHCLALQGAREFIERRFEHDQARPLLIVTLDLSTASSALGVFGRGYDYNYRDEILDSVLPLCRILRRLAEQLTPILGETIPRVVLTDAANQSDNRTWKNSIPAKFAFDCEPFMSAGYNSITFATIDDARRHVDTPDDTFDRVNIANLHRQVQILTVMLNHVLNDPVAQAGDDVVPLHPPSPRRISLTGGFATASGYVAVYDPSKSLVPDLRVPGSLAVRVVGKKTLMGVRGDEIQLTSGAGASYEFVGLPPSTDYSTLFKPDTVILAYHLDPTSGRVDYAPDDGPFGFDAFPTSGRLKTSERISPIVVFPCVSVSLFGLIDPQELAPFQSADILDPVGGGRPKTYGFSASYFDETSVSEADDSAVLFLPAGQRFQLLMGSATGDDRLLLTGSTPADPAGKGYLISGNTLGDVSLKAARDICNINQARIDEFAKYRILSAGVLALQRQALDEIHASEQADVAGDWASAQRHARAAWGIALRAHPILRGTAGDVVDGVVFYSFLLIPFSFFFERLMFASRSLTKQLAGTIAIFVGAFVLLRFVHPAFEIVSNPAMIFVGFVMGALSLIVITFIFGKFETALRSVKQAQSGVREVDVRRSNVAMAAFSLGISNLRRRKARTILTTLTLSVMTFIVLSFTSIVPELQLNENATANVARYGGILLRDPSLQPLQMSAYNALSNEFAGRGLVSRRVFAYGSDIQQGAAISVQLGDKWADASAVEGLDPSESSLTHPQDALLPGGRWFKPGERDAIILPKGIAAKLDFAPSQVGKATMRYMGGDYLVIGIFDPELMRRVVDLDGDSILPPDYTLTTQLQKESRSQTRAFRKFIRLDPDVVFFLPAETALALGGDLRSVGVALFDPRETAGAMASLMPRLRLNLYGSVVTSQGLEVRQFSELQGSKSTGLVLVLIQLAIAAVFVLNTMIASVYERTREISIFSAIGLAPNHISTLFFAESLVYGVLGTVFGYFAAQAVAKVIVATGAFPQLTLNFSSSSAIMAALVVIGVVLLSTIYPARKAAQIAAPAHSEEAMGSEPEGDNWVLPLPFSVSASEAAPLIAFLADWLQAYEEYTIGEFVTSGTRQGPYRVTSTAWLTPYDLGISQELMIEARPGGVPDTYILDLTLRRLSGESKSWETVNRRFLATMRRQFLTWRTLTESERARFVAQAPSL